MTGVLVCYSVGNIVTLNKHMAELPFFAACVSSGANEIITLTRFGDIFNALNNNQLSNLIENVYDKPSKRNRINMLRNILNGLDYFQYETTEFYQLINKHEQKLYEIEVNKYIISKLIEYPLLLIYPNVLYSSEIYERFPNRIVMDIFNQAFIKTMPISMLNHIHRGYPKGFYMLAFDPYVDITILSDTDTNLLIVRYSANMQLVDNVLTKHPDLLVSSLENKYIDEEFIEKHYIHILNYLQFIHLPNTRCNYKKITNVLLRRGDFDQWSNISAEFLPLDFVTYYSHRLNFTYAHYNDEITTDVYDRIKFIHHQYAQLSENDKLSESLIHNHDNMDFNINNKNLSDEFILAHANRILPSSIHMRPMSSEFVIKLANAVVSFKKTGININVLVALMNKKNTDVNLILNILIKEMYPTLVYSPVGFKHIDEFRDVCRFEFINKNMNLLHKFQVIPFSIYKKYNICTLFDRIKSTHDSDVESILRKGHM
jgi:hypothetical protein